MQEKNEKTHYIAVILGQIIRELRLNNKELTLNTLANEYDLHKGTISKLENGEQNCQFITLWKISEALGIKCSKLITILEEKLGEDFTFIDE